MTIEVVFDTETTGLLKPIGTALEFQPYICEIAILRFENGRLQNELNTLIKPPVPIPYHLTKNVHGIDDRMVENMPSYWRFIEDTIKLFKDADVSIAQNLTFDEGILIYEFQRLGLKADFLFKPQRFCTIEQSMHLKGFRMKNNELYKMATGKEIEGSHRAYNDALATYEVYKWLKNGK